MRKVPKASIQLISAKIDLEKTKINEKEAGNGHLYLKSCKFFKSQLPLSANKLPLLLLYKLQN